jgi:transposase InsO family protein
LILPRARVKHQRLSDEQRAEILQLVAKSPLPVSQTLATLGIPRFTYYHWRGPQRRRAAGTPPEEPPPRRCAWNRLRDWEVAKVLEYAHRDPDIASRELACKLTDEAGFSVSESTVYRILKRHNLLPTAPILLAAAANEYHRKTTCVNELWQTDLTYFHVVGWGWYFVGGVLDDYSRYLICHRVVRDMTGQTLTDLVQEAVEITGLCEVPAEYKPALLSDNGSGYVSKLFNDYLETQQIRHIFAARFHPQTVGKFERLNRTTKSKLGLVVYRSPEELQREIDKFHYWYNYQHYHEALGNLRPADVYFGRGEEILSRRREVKRRTLALRRQHNLALGPGSPEEPFPTSQVHLNSELELSKYR